MKAWCRIAAGAAWCIASAGHAQGTSDKRPALPTEPRSVSGRIFLGTRKAQLPLADHWVVLHRIDMRGSGFGPVDSMRTGADGRYAFHYTAMTSDSVLYLVLTNYGGIAYPQPLREAQVSGAEAEITVFDTTSSGMVPIHVRGRHLVVAGPRDGRMRTVLEVFDLSNDSTLTIIPRVVGRDSQPVWTTHLPAGATDVRINPEGIEGTVSQRGDQLAIVAPLSPGLRRLSFTYTLPPERFPLDVPLQHETELMEVLLQEPTGDVDGPALSEVAAVTADGESFRRFLGQDLPKNGTIRVTVPAAGDLVSSKVIRILASVLGGLMLLAITVAFVRQQRSAPGVVVDPIDALLRELATIDAKFEHAGDPTPESRADYDRSRAAAKAKLTTALARRAGSSSGATTA